MIKEMNKKIFKEYLEMTLDEIKQKKKIISENDLFLIVPIVEKGKVLTAKDEMMRLNIINKNRVNNRFFSKEETISMLTFFSPLVPIWIDMEYILNDKSKKSFFKIKCSVRLRKPSLLRNQETGHPPFRAII